MIMHSLILIIVFQAFAILTYSQSTIKCMIATGKGNIYIELYPEKAPVTVSNFLKYVENKLYDNSNFFRVCTPENEKDRSIKIEVIQGGDIQETEQFEAINIETTAQSGLKHLDGTISMARDKPNSAGSGFFICINNQPELDFGGKRNADGYGFAAFGRVTKGMNVVRKIQQLENKNQILIKPVRIKYIRIVN